MDLNLLHPPERRFWICRASKGMYFDHFRNHGVVGMSHFDKMPSLQISPNFEVTQEKLYKFLKKDPEIEERTANNHVNQALTFIYEASIDDIVITVNARRLLIGVITSDAYFEKSVLTVQSKNVGKDDIEMPAFLRRDVKWISSINRESIPFSLSRAIMGNQTFFNLDKLEDEIYSLVAAFVYKSGTLSANFRIEQEQGISAYQYTLFNQTVFKCEFLAKNMTKLPSVKTEQELRKMFVEFCEKGRVRSNLKAEFASPGWTALEISMLLGSSGFFIVLLNIALGGGKTSLEFTKEKGFKANAETPGLLNAKLVQYIGKRLTDTGIRAIDRFLKEDNPERIKESLGLKKPPQSQKLDLLQGEISDPVLGNVFTEDNSDESEEP